MNSVKDDYPNHVNIVLKYKYLVYSEYEQNIYVFSFCSNM